MKTILAVIMIAALAVGIFSISQVQAKTYKIKFNINVADRETLACMDQLYVRASDGEADSNGEHKILLAKQTIFDPTALKYSVTKKFDPRKTIAHSGQIREYLLAEKDEAVIYKDYKHPYTPFDSKRTQYTFTHNVPHLSCDSGLRTLQVAPGDRN
jgi:hypothetical protein